MVSNHYKSIERVSSSYLCSNCGACKVICPKDAISFNSSSIGRIFAEVSDDCVNCGLCQKVCPSLNNIFGEVKEDNLMGTVLSVNVGKAQDEKIYKNSQSGGICTALLKYLFETDQIDGALVCRMNYGNPIPKVEPIIINNIDDLMTSQKSCYSAVELLGTLRENTKKYKSLAIVGVGCHIEGIIGLEQFVKDIKERIFCKFGLICDRTLCGTIQKVYTSFLNGNEPKKIIWRCKYASFLTPEAQYKTAPLVIEDRLLHRKILPNIYRFALKDMFTSPRCRICPDKLNLWSDITLGDPWKMSNIDWIGGESVVIGRTQKGETILHDAISKGYISLSSRPLKELAEGQYIEERKEQVKTYSQAFQCLNPKLSSYLFNQSDGIRNQKLIEEARKKLLAFKEREKLSVQEIIKEARTEIKKAELRQTFLYRALRKLYKVVKR